MYFFDGESNSTVSKDYLSASDISQIKLVIKRVCDYLIASNLTRKYNNTGDDSIININKLTSLISKELNPLYKNFSGYHDLDSGKSFKGYVYDEIHKSLDTLIARESIDAIESDFLESIINPNNKRTELTYN